MLLGRRGDGPVAVAAFIAAQREDHGVPHAVACRALGVSPAWFYKWRHGDPSARHARQIALAAEHRLVVSVEDNGVVGGCGPMLLQTLNAAGVLWVRRLALRAEAA